MIKENTFWSNFWKNHYGINFVIYSFMKPLLIKPDAMYQISNAFTVLAYTRPTETNKTIAVFKS